MLSSVAAPTDPAAYIQHTANTTTWVRCNRLRLGSSHGCVTDAVDFHWVTRFNSRVAGDIVKGIHTHTHMRTCTLLTVISVPSRQLQQDQQIGAAQPFLMVWAILNALLVYLENENKHIQIMKKALGETPTLHAGCSKAVPKIFAPRRPLPSGAGRPKLNQLEMITTFTYKPSLVRIDA